MKKRFEDDIRKQRDEIATQLSADDAEQGYATFQGVCIINIYIYVCVVCVLCVCDIYIYMCVGVRMIYIYTCVCVMCGMCEGV